MRARDLFGVGVRLFGVWLICRGMVNVATFTYTKLYAGSDREAYGASGTLIFAIFDFMLAGLFLFKTDFLVGWSYEGERGGQRVESSRSGFEP